MALCYKKLFKQLIDRNMMKKDFRDNGLKVFHYWVKQRHKYQLSFRDILFYFLLEFIGYQLCCKIDQERQ